MFRDLQKMTLTLWWRERKTRKIVATWQQCFHECTNSYGRQCRWLCVEPSAEYNTCRSCHPKKVDLSQHIEAYKTFCSEVRWWNAPSLCGFAGVWGKEGIRNMQEKEQCHVMCFFAFSLGKNGDSISILGSPRSWGDDEQTPWVWLSNARSQRHLILF